MYDYQKHSSNNEEDDDDDYYYDYEYNKRKRQQQQQQRQKTMKSFNKLRAEFYNKNLTSISNRRLVVIILIVLVIVFFIHNSSPTSEVEIILDVNKMQLEKVDRSSIILDALRKKSNNRNNNEISSNIVDDREALVDNSPGDQPGIPAFRLITEFKNGIYFYNIHEPTETWWPFECLSTRMKQALNTMVCIHDPKFDKHISRELKERGMWEPTNIRSFLNLLNDLNDTNVIDIGANIGVYSLFAAKLGRNVIAVEPLHENLNRLHKAAQLEGIQSKIIALVNAVGNERNQLKLSIMDYNIGGTYVLQPDLVDPEQKFFPTSTSVLVNSILMDDLVDVAEARLNKSAQRKFIVKIDIEGYEPFVFEQASRLFTSFQIPAVFMEFGKSVEKLALQKNENSTYASKIRNMLEFFKSRNYQPYEVNGINKLDYSKWRNDWPWDVFFKKCDLIFCPNHVYKLGD